MAKYDPIDDCRFYKRQESNPYAQNDPRSFYWWLESAYVHSVLPYEYLMQEYGYNFSIDFPDRMETFSTPFYMKAFFYDRYTNAGGSKEGFPDWMKRYSTL